MLTNIGSHPVLVMKLTLFRPKGGHHVKADRIRLDH